MSDAEKFIVELQQIIQMRDEEITHLRLALSDKDKQYNELFKQATEMAKLKPPAPIVMKVTDGAFEDD